MGAESAPQSISGVQPGFAVPRYRYRIGRAGSAKSAKFHEGPKRQARNRNKLPGPDFCTLNACPPRSGAAAESDSATRPTTGARGAEKSGAGSGSLLAGAEIDGAGALARVLAPREDLGLLHFLGARGGQALDEEDPARGLEVGEPAETPVGELGGQPRICRRASHGHHARHDFLFAGLVGRGEHGHLGHGLVGLQTRLHLRGRDVLAGAADDVLLAVDEIEHAARMPADEVAGMEPAAPPRLFGCLRVLQVAREEAVAGAFGPAPADEELALAVRGQLLVALVDHAGPEAAMRPAEGARVGLPGPEGIRQGAPPPRPA